MATIELKTMKAVRDHWHNPFVHSYFWIRDRHGWTWVVEGYPEPLGKQEFLQAWIHLGDVGRYALSDARTQPQIWRASGVDYDSSADRLLRAAAAFPRLTVPYRMLTGPNSNSFLHFLALQAGLHVPRPAFAVGWDVGIET